jgi:3-oxoacyl-[acyl-carrier-protein] synthase-3
MSTEGGSLMGAAITGWGKSLPEGRLDNAELAKRFDVTEDWIVQRTGIHSRRVAGPEDTTSSLAIAAGHEALKRAGVDASEIDMVIVATCTPDHPIPAAAPLVQAGLGAVNAGAYDVNAVCAGFLYSLAQASAMIDSGSAQKILVCGADVFTRVTDYSDIGSAIIFGDGAGAVVVEAIPGAPNLGPFKLRADGSTAKLLWIPPGKDVVDMKGREIYRYAVEEMTRSVRDVLSAAYLSATDIDLLIAHQANVRILKAVAERLGLSDDKVMINLQELGNTSAGSIPIALYDAAESGRLENGDLVLLTAIGGGLVWGAGAVRWRTKVAPSREFAVVGDTRA